MTAAKRASEETTMPTTKRTRKSSAITPAVSAPPSVAESGQRMSSDHGFLDDTTGFADGLSLRHFINPKAAKLYNKVRVSAIAFS